MKRPFFLLLLLLSCGSLHAQMVRSRPSCGLSPLLYIRFIGPPGMHATFYQGRPQGRSFEAPVAVGMRPGYFYRLQLSHIAGHPGVSIFPTLEVRGSLRLQRCFKAADYPAPLVLSEEDIASVLAGNLVSKVIYLEDPDRARPATTPADLPFEMDLPPGHNLLTEAHDRGRPMLIVRMGGRLLFSDDELARSTVPGTILYPGEKALARPAAPPCVLEDCRPFYDPRIGPKPLEEECLHDGGDGHNRAGFDREGRLAGVEPEDTVAEYTDSYGRRHLTHSNRVCLCVPRFAVIRCEIPLNRYESVTAVNNTRHVRYHEGLAVRTPALQTQQYEQLKAAHGREKLQINQGASGSVGVTHMEMLNAVNVPLGPLAALATKKILILSDMERTRLSQQLEFTRQLSSKSNVQSTTSMEGTRVVGRIEAGARIVQAEAETRDLTVCCNEAPCPPDRPLVLVKCADRASAKVGDVVTFTLKYSNHGGKPIADVAVTDSLTTRLEYVPGSSQSDRPAVFTTQLNEAGSLILHWEITGRLMPGAHGVVRFQARIR